MADEDLDFDFENQLKADDGQGLTLVHFSAQPEPCLTPKHTPFTLYNP